MKDLLLSKQTHTWLMNQNVETKNRGMNVYAMFKKVRELWG